MSTKESILKKFEGLKGQFVIISNWKIERLVAVAEDLDDYYYITYNGSKLNFQTCLCKLVQLKGKLDERDYNEFERLSRLNHYDKLIRTETYRCYHSELGQPLPTLDEYKQSLISTWDVNDKLLTEIIFDDE